VEPIPDVQQQIDALQKRIDAAKNVQQLSARQIPAALQPIQFDLQPMFDVLRRQLQDVERHAEAVVKAHLTKHGVHGFEDWACRGQSYLTGDECPFCGQSIAGLDLIRAYRSHFNNAYNDLKRDVDSLDEQVAAALADSKADRLRAATETNTARVEAWRDRLDVTSPAFAADGLLAALKQARESLQRLIAAKRLAPLEVIGTQVEQDTVARVVDSINQIIAAYNIDVAAVTTKITEFKQKLAAESIVALQSELQKLEAEQKRQQPAAIAAANGYQSAETERKRLQAEKEKARAAVDTLMTTTLQKLQVDINSLLTTFGAEFSIEQLKHTSVGTGEPRTEYALSVRNKSVKLGSRADLVGSHSFATTLSDSDKRTLAFAFFLARLRSDPNLADSVVVLDDPVSSLDRNRRYQSVRLIAGIAAACQQLIVLSHDPYFIRELREHLAALKPNPIPLGIIGIKRVQNGYSAFGGCDIDDICSSDYYRHHKLVADYVDGKSTANIREIAKAIRPLLEGYYHRRFPRRISRKLMFGGIIDLARQAQAGDPLAYLHPLLRELGEVNDYAGRFHHDANPDPETVPVVDGELLPFARQALNLIYQNG
jgi:wobble nucleotide-excising tRNase